MYLVGWYDPGYHFSDVGVFCLHLLRNYMMAPLRWYERILALIGALGLLYPGTLSDFCGVAILLVLCMVTKRRQ